MGNPPTPLNHSNWKDSAESGRGTPPPLPLPRLPAQSTDSCTAAQLFNIWRVPANPVKAVLTQHYSQHPHYEHLSLSLKKHNSCLLNGFTNCACLQLSGVVKSAHNSSRSLEWMWNFQKQLKPLVTLYQCCKVPKYETVDHDLWLFQWLLS